MSLRFISYTRVSTEDQADYGTGLETQSLENQEYVRRLQRTPTEAETVQRLGAELVGVESDPGISGTVYPRPGMENALQRLKSGEANALIVHRVDRLGRELYIPPLVFKRIQDMGCRLFSVEDGEITDAAILLFALRAGMAQTDHKGIVKRLKDGKRRMAEKGLQPNRMNRPYGYHIVQKIENDIVQHNAGTYQIIEAEASIVQRIFADYAAGLSLLGMAKTLQRSGIPTVKGGKWWPQTIRQILRNPVYKGTLLWGQTQNVYTSGTFVRAVPTEAASHITIPVPPIVTAELWKACQERLVAAKGDTSRHSHRQLFTGLIVCPTCLRRCRASSYAVRDTIYRCKDCAPSSSSSGVVCNNATYREADIIASLKKQLRVIHPERLAAAILAHQAKSVKQFNPAVLEKMQRELREAEREAGALLDAEISARVRGADLTTIQKRQAVNESRQRALQREIDTLEAMTVQETPEQVMLGVRQVWAFSVEVLEVLESDGQKFERNQLLRVRVERIVPTEKRGFRVEWRGASLSGMWGVM